MKSSTHEKAPVVGATGALDNVNRTRKNVEMNDSTALTNVIPFNFGEQQVRTLLITDQPWFVAADIAQALEYRIAGDMTRNLDEDEKGTQIVRTPGGDQEMLVINESGLYSAILRSRKAEAKRFKKWVTAEVLPAIRKHGRYEESAGKMATLIGQTIGTDGFHMLGAIVKGKVSSLPQHAQRRATAKIWSQTHVAFGVRSAADIPAEQLDAARNFIAAYTVHEGEYIPAPKKDGIYLDRFEAHHLYLLMTRIHHLRNYKDQIYTVADTLGSKWLISFWDQLREAGSSFGVIDKRGEELHSVYRSYGSDGGYRMGRAAA